jgi:hypothetical protein
LEWIGIVGHSLGFGFCDVLKMTTKEFLAFTKIAQKIEEQRQ